MNFFTLISKWKIQKTQFTSEATWALLGSTELIHRTMRVLYRVDKYCNTDTAMHVRTHAQRFRSSLQQHNSIQSSMISTVSFQLHLSFWHLNEWACWSPGTNRWARSWLESEDQACGHPVKPGSIHLKALSLGTHRVARVFVPRSNKDHWDSCSWVGGIQTRLKPL
jgi:hypothetical protein